MMTELNETVGQALADLIDVGRLEPKLRAIADQIYEQILEDVEEYLKSNTSFNVQAQIDALQHQNNEYRPYYNACAGLNPAAIPGVVDDLKWLLSGDVDVSGTALILGDDSDAIAFKIRRIRDNLEDLDAQP